MIETIYLEHLQFYVTIMIWTFILWISSNEIQYFNIDRTNIHFTIIFLGLFWKIRYLSNRRGLFIYEKFKCTLIYKMKRYRNYLNQNKKKMPYTELITGNSITKSRLVKDYILTFNLINKIEIFTHQQTFLYIIYFTTLRINSSQVSREYINGPYN